MRIHHLDCGSLRPPGGVLMDGVSSGFFGRLTCHCLAIETSDGVVLVDTGFGMRDMLHPWPRLPTMNTLMLRPRLDTERTMLRQLQRRGIAPRDVRHIVMTHLDFDHAGGLADFPEARVHLMEDEAVAAKRREGVLGRIRWRPAQWGNTNRWHTYPERAGGRWFGFDAVVQLDNVPPEILLVPLPGHTPGHAGVAIETPRGWVLHAADTYFNRAEVHADGAAVPPGAAAYEYLMAWDSRLGRANQARVRELVRDPGAKVAVFCTHDPVEFVAMSAWSERGARRAANDPETQDDAHVA